MTSAPKKNPKLHQYRQRRKRVFCRCQPHFKPNDETFSILRSYLKSYKELFFNRNSLQTNGGRQLKICKILGSSHLSFLKIPSHHELSSSNFYSSYSTSTVKNRGKDEVITKFPKSHLEERKKIFGNIKGLYV